MHKSIRYIPTLVAGILILIIGCTSKHQFSDMEVKQVSALRSELDSIDAELSNAEVEFEQFAGGHLKSLLNVRIQVLKTTRNIVQQRIHAIEGGAPVTEIVTSTAPDSILVKQLDEEIAQQIAAVRIAQISREEYGGLLGALRETRVATEENTLAFLKQKRVMARYGLTLPKLPVPQSSIEMLPKIVAEGKRIVD